MKGRLPKYFREICFSGGKQTIHKVLAAFIVKNCHPRTSLTLLIPSCFGPTLYIKRGGGHLDPPPTISSTIGCTYLKFCRVLKIPCMISENTRFAKRLLYGYHGNCLITWCFSLIIVKKSMKNRYFSNAPRNYKLKGVKIKLCVMIVLFWYFAKK